MRLRYPECPEVLLLLWMFLPLGRGYSRVLAAQVLLSQIKAVHIAQRAEKKLNLALDNNSDKPLRDCLSALWFDPGNLTAHAYFQLLILHLGLLDSRDESSMIDRDLALGTEEVSPYDGESP